MPPASSSQPAPAPALTLISHALCPYVQRVAIALAEKGLPFERVTIDLDHKPAWFLALSPTGKVPLLRVPGPAGQDVVLFESSVICEYIEETATAVPLHPADAVQRAQHRAWMEFGSGLLGQVWKMETARDAASHEAARQALATGFARVEAALDADGPYFAGKCFGLVDAVFAPVFRYFDIFDTLTDTGVFVDCPRVRRWRKALARRPSVQQAVGPDYPARLLRFLADHQAHLLALSHKERA